MNDTDEKDIIEAIKRAKYLTVDKKQSLILKIERLLWKSTEPISTILWVPIKKLTQNTYNPNKMAIPEKKLLMRSMLYHGITSPLVVLPEHKGQYTIIDGYHRWKLIKKNKELSKRLKYKVPVVALNLLNSEEIIATIRHNRARGCHQIGEIGEVVKILSNKGWTDQNIMTELGMDADEVLRLKQFKGLGEVFKDDDYSNSWY